MARVPDRIAIWTLTLTGCLLPAWGEGDARQPAWGLPESLATDLAEQADSYRRQSRGLSCIETVRSVRYRPVRPLVKERKYAYLPGGSSDDRFIPELRLEIKPNGPVRRRLSREVRRFPSASDWARLFGAEQQPYFMYRDLGIRIEGFDLVRAIEFRGWLPFTDGRDIREWEGTALVEVTRLELVEVRARPRNQQARLAALYDKWNRSFKITLGLFAGPFFVPLKTFRTARPPLAFHAFVRFDHRHRGVRLATLLRYETRRATSRDETVRRSTSTRQYDRYQVVAPRSAGFRPMLDLVRAID